jgi:hypothetical protein
MSPEYIEKDSYCFQSLNIKEYSAGLEIRKSRAHTRHTHTYLDCSAPSGRVPFAKKEPPRSDKWQTFVPFFLSLDSPPSHVQYLW